MLEVAATAWRTFDVSLDRDEMGHCFKSLVHKGRSLTTLIKFYPILTTYSPSYPPPSQVENCGILHTTYPFHVIKRSC